jgi:hypothetical protein
MCGKTYVNKIFFSFGVLTTFGIIFLNGLIKQWGLSATSGETHLFVSYTSSNSYEVISQLNRNRDVSHLDREVFWRQTANSIYKSNTLDVAWLTIGY